MNFKDKDIFLMVLGIFLVVVFLCVDEFENVIVSEGGFFGLFKFCLWGDFFYKKMRLKKK